MWAVHDEPLQQHLGFRVEGEERGV
jgi:hypothetical protein